MFKSLKKENFIPLSPEEYNVYSDLLKQRFKYPKLFVINDRTESEKERLGAPESQKEQEEWVKEVKKIFELQQEKEILDDFITKNSQSYSLDKKFNLENYILINKKALYKTWAEKRLGWEEFYKRYPGAKGAGIIWFSRVGFNSERNKALVRIGARQADLAGEGDLILLEKKNNVWIIQKKRLEWIS